MPELFREFQSSAENLWEPKVVVRREDVENSFSKSIRIPLKSSPLISPETLRIRLGIEHDEGRHVLKCKSCFGRLET